MTNLEYAAAHPEEFAEALVDWLEDALINTGYGEFDEDTKHENIDMLIEYFNGESKN